MNQDILLLRVMGIALLVVSFGKWFLGLYVDPYSMPFIVALAGFCLTYPRRETNRSENSSTKSVD